MTAPAPKADSQCSNCGQPRATGSNLYCQECEDWFNWQEAEAADVRPKPAQPETPMSDSRPPLIHWAGDCGKPIAWIDGRRVCPVHGECSREECETPPTPETPMTPIPPVPSIPRPMPFEPAIAAKCERCGHPPHEYLKCPLYQCDCNTWSPSNPKPASGDVGAEKPKCPWCGQMAKAAPVRGWHCLNGACELAWFAPPEPPPQPAGETDAEIVANDRFDEIWAVCVLNGMITTVPSVEAADPRTPLDLALKFIRSLVAEIDRLTKERDMAQADADAEHKIFEDLTAALGTRGVDFDTLRTVEQDIAAFLDAKDAELAALRDRLTAPPQAEGPVTAEEIGKWLIAADIERCGPDKWYPRIEDGKLQWLATAVASHLNARIPKAAEGPTAGPVTGEMVKEAWIHFDCGADDYFKQIAGYLNAALPKAPAVRLTVEDVRLAIEATVETPLYEDRPKAITNILNAALDAKAGRGCDRG